VEIFAHRRDLSTDLQLVFFDTTSISFEGEGGRDIGQRGFSKDHRPDL
jgi:transposase